MALQPAAFGAAAATPRRAMPCCATPWHVRAPFSSTCKGHRLAAEQQCNEDRDEQRIRRLADQHMKQRRALPSQTALSTAHCTARVAHCLARARAAEEPMRTERAPRVHAEKRRPAYIAHKQPEAAGYHRAGGVTCMHRWRH
jgi:hypothetical protein